MNEPSSVPPPGTDEAVKAGCRCPGRDGYVFSLVVSEDCPLHGRPAWEAGARERKLDADMAAMGYRVGDAPLGWQPGCRCPTAGGERYIVYAKDCPVHWELASFTAPRVGDAGEEAGASRGEAS